MPPLARLHNPTSLHPISRHTIWFPRIGNCSTLMHLSLRKHKFACKMHDLQGSWSRLTMPLFSWNDCYADLATVKQCSTVMDKVVHLSYMLHLSLVVYGNKVHSVCSPHISPTPPYLTMVTAVRVCFLLLIVDLLLSKYAVYLHFFTFTVHSFP